jgi:predicted SAM-dependent methyltransferase
MNYTKSKNKSHVLTLLKRGVRKIYRGPASRTSRYPSETSKCRSRLAPYCEGYGLDLGFGGDAITPKAIRVDAPQPYADTGTDSVQLGGDASELRWFRDGVLDYVYSSHLLEDFEDTEGVLREWLRVIRPGGNLIVFCPDEQLYRGHCNRTGLIPNENHSHADFSLVKVKEILKRIGGLKIVHERSPVDIYSWELVAKKSSSMSITVMKE